MVMGFQIVLLVPLILLSLVTGTPENPTPRPTKNPTVEGCPVPVSRPPYDASAVQRYFAFDLGSTVEWFVAQECCNSVWESLAVIDSSPGNRDTTTQLQAYNEMYAECFSVTQGGECWIGLKESTDEMMWMDRESLPTYSLIEEFWDAGADPCQSGSGCQDVCTSIVTEGGANDPASWGARACNRRGEREWISCDDHVNPPTGLPSVCTEGWHYYDSPQYAVCGNNNPMGIMISGGDSFIELGQFRIGIADTAKNHFTVSSSEGRTNQIFREDGTGPRYNYATYGTWGKSLGSMGPPNVEYTSHGIIFDNTWCIGMTATNHLSVAHIDGQTSMIWREDGTEHQGPRTDYNCFTSNSNYPNTITSDGSTYIQFNDEWRIGVVDSRLLVSHYGGRTAIAYNTDGSNTRNTDAGWTHNPTAATGSPTAPPTSSPTATPTSNPNTVNVPGGESFIELGVFRIGIADTAKNHFTVSSSEGRTNQIFRQDGTGPRYNYATYGTWGKSLGSMGPWNVEYTSHGIIFDNTWCIGMTATNHLSVAHIDGQTSMIWREDGTEHQGPRTDYNCFYSNYDNTITSDGSTYIQFNDEWRIGVVNSHLSVSHYGGRTAIAYDSDGSNIRNTDAYSWTYSPTKTPTGSPVDPGNINNPLPPNQPSMITLSSPYFIIIVSLLSLLLIANVVFVGYSNCCSSARIRRSGYESVKYVDSESFGDSEA